MKKLTGKFGLFCALVLVGAFGARADETSKIPAAANAPIIQPTKGNSVWLAFLVYQGGFTSPEYFMLNQTPYIMLFENGRLFWRDDNIKYDAPNRRRDMWREAMIAPDALRKFVAKAKAIDFLTIQPPPEVAPVPDENGVIQLRPQICDAATTVLGLSVSVPRKNRAPSSTQRIISEYALGAFGDEDKDNRYIQALMTMQKMLLDLRPKESKRFEPDAIRVTFMDGNSRGVIMPEPGVAIQKWPFADKPNLDSANIYFGDKARNLVEILSKNPIIKVGDQIVSANWTPAIAVPQNLSGKTTATTFKQ